ncbi:hypothetical protein [Streptomyces capitiformicae]|uniref:Uncharacterized protein n=1 Tax=Streptomyces capitiformicae TaxID=2014920 RepID=A0A918ZE00_9ACTN|nr:hypothetical protein [Streptomyces capitiformicae]GHE47538.1 hypothetical protein GCM10017771_68420 [Streptomyces capitiformicae]
MDHLAELARPGGGTAYPVDANATGFRLPASGCGAQPPRTTRWTSATAKLHRCRGNSFGIDTQLYELLTTAGPEVTAYKGHINVMTPRPACAGLPGPRQHLQRHRPPRLTPGPVNTTGFDGIRGPGHPPGDHSKEQPGFGASSENGEPWGRT